MATETEERIVGKKYRVLKNIVVFVFLTRKIANKSANEVWKITTMRVNRTLFPRTLRKRSSFVNRLTKLRTPTNSTGSIPFHRVAEYLSVFNAGYR
jgi:hypothetical protein